MNLVVENSLDLSANNLIILKQIVAGYGIAKYYKLRKFQLIEAIVHADLMLDNSNNNFVLSPKQQTTFEIHLPTEPLPSAKEIEQAVGIRNEEDKEDQSVLVSIPWEKILVGEEKREEEIVPEEDFSDKEDKFFNALRRPTRHQENDDDGLELVSPEAESSTL